MSSGLRVSQAEGRAVADEMIAALEPACERIEIAGSLRRGAADVGDVEIVAIPRHHAEPSGLFFEVDAVVWDLEAAIDRLVASGTVDRQLGKDRYTKLKHRSSGLQVDLFSVKPPAQWGVIYLIRTGSADYSHGFMTALRKRGFHVREGALHRGGLGCGAYECEVIPTPEEQDVYDATGLPYLSPQLR